MESTSKTETFTTAQLGNTGLATMTIHKNADLLLQRILLAGRLLDVFNELLAMALTCLSHFPLVLSRMWFLCDTGSVARHDFYAGR
jgi:superfamily II RNA helicase